MKQPHEKSTRIALPVLNVDADRTAGTRMGRRRAIVLTIVHVLVALHILHYLLTGSTISPLEPSEAGHTLRTGAINAGTIFLCVLIIATLIFGRFACGWACHLVAYQDLARWILIKLGLRPKPVRARLLMLVPLFAVYWLYGKPLLERWRAGDGGGLSWHLASDDFWATFPGPTISILSFAVCGFAVIWFLGAKGFCTYACPYGALFGIADKAARGRIRVNEDCTQTGRCTQNCSSNVDVASEVAAFGMVVDPGCMKCMDCVAGCPNNALSFGFTQRVQREPAGKGKRHLRPARRYDFTWVEEIFMLGAFAGSFWVFFNLYGVLPFLLSLGLCTILAYGLLVAARLFYRKTVPAHRLVLKDDGRLTGAGIAYAAAALLALAATAHGAFIQWHTKRAVALKGEAQLARVEGHDQEMAALARRALPHAAFCDKYGLFPVRGMGHITGELHRWRGESEAALPHYERELRVSPHNRNVPMYMGLALHELGRIDEAREYYERAFDQASPPLARFQQLDWELNRMLQNERLPSLRVRTAVLRMEMLRSALKVYPGNADFAINLCRLLVTRPDVSLRDREEALRVAESACAADERSSAELLGVLAYLYGGFGRFDEAVQAAEDGRRIAEEDGSHDLADRLNDDLALYRSRAGDGGR